MNYRSYMTHSGHLFRDLVGRLTASEPARPNTPDLKNNRYRIETKCTLVTNSVSVDVNQFAKYRSINDSRKLLYAVGFYYLDGAKIEDIRDADDMNRYQRFESINFLNEDVIEARRTPKVKKFICISKHYADEMASGEVGEEYPNLDMRRLAKYDGQITIPRISGTNKVKLRIYDDLRTHVEHLADTIKKNARRMNARGLTAQSKLKDWI